MLKKLCFLCFFLFSSLSQANSSYPEEYLNFSEKLDDKIAVAVVAFNRPEYLMSTIACIEKNPESQTLPFFFFLDGGKKAKQAENIKLIESSLIKNKYIILRPFNFGIIKNHFDSKRFLFDWCHFEKVIVMEEDVEISQDYFSKLLKLDHWAHHTYSNIGSVQLWSECYLTKESKKTKLFKVRQTIPFYSFVTYCIRRSTWDDISPYLYEYEKKFIDPTLEDESQYIPRSKPGLGKYKNQIIQWHRNNESSLSSNLPSFELTQKAVIPSIFKNFDQIDNIHNQDMMMAYTMLKKGYVRLQTVVNHAKHIGIDGFIIKGRKEHIPIRIDELPIETENFNLTRR